MNSEMWPRLLLTMLNVPIKTGGGVAPALTISEMKLAVMPMMAIIEEASRALAALKVMPSAP